MGGKQYDVSQHIGCQSKVTPCTTLTVPSAGLWTSRRGLQMSYSGADRQILEYGQLVVAEGKNFAKRLLTNYRSFECSLPTSSHFSMAARAWELETGFPCMFPLVHFSARFRERKNVFPCTRKRVCRITEFAWSSLGISTVFTVQGHARACCISMSNTRRKVAYQAAFPCAGEVLANGKVFMEMVIDKCSRMTFVLTETHTWKAGLSWVKIPHNECWSHPVGQHPVVMCFLSDSCLLPQWWCHQWTVLSSDWNLTVICNIVWLALHCQKPCDLSTMWYLLLLASILFLYAKSLCCTINTLILNKSVVYLGFCNLHEVSKESRKIKSGHLSI